MAISSRAVCLLLLSLALCQAVSAQPTPLPTLTENIVGVFDNITAKSDALRTKISALNLLNAPLLGLAIAPGLTGIGNTLALATSALSALPPTAALADADAQLVLQSLTAFVQQEQALLNTLISKEGILSLLPFSAPISQALDSLEQAVNAFATALIALIPTQAPAATLQFAALAPTLDQAQAAFA